MLDFITSDFVYGICKTALWPISYLTGIGSILEDFTVGDPKKAFFILIAYMLVIYIFGALTFKKVADRLGLSHSWLACIPLVRQCMYAPILFRDNCVIASLFTFFWVWLGSFSGASYPFNHILCYIPLFLMQMFYNYKFYSMLSKKAKTLITIDILTCGMISPILGFTVRNNEFTDDKLNLKIDSSNVKN